MADLSDDEQETLVGEMTMSMDSGYDEAQFEADYAKLDPHYQRQVDDATREFQDNAIGWNDDDD
jgi:hypothetical protein